MRMRRSWLLVLAGLLLLPATAQGLDPFNGSTVTRLFDTEDVNDVVAEPFLNLIQSHQLAVDSGGDVFLAFNARNEVTRVGFFQEVIRYREDGTGGFTIDSVHRVDASTPDAGAIRAMVVAPTDTLNGNSEPVLVKDRIVLLVDGYDTTTDTPWREIQMLDPDGVAAPVVLFREEPGGTNSASGGLSGTLHFAVDDSGTFYVLVDGSRGAADDGNIHRLTFDDVAGEYTDEAIMTEGTAMGVLATRSNGLVYSGRRSRLGEVIEVDPSGTDLISTYSEGGFVAIVFDSNDRGWSDVGFPGKNLNRTITEFFDGEKINKADRIAGTDNRFQNRSITADVNGAVYILEVEIDNDIPTPDLVALWKVEPDSGSTPPPPSPGGTASVDSISYRASGGPSGDRNIKITLAIVDQDGAAIAGADLTFTVTHGLEFDNFAQSTDSSGEATVTLRNAPSGDYETTVDNVVASGFTFDGVTPSNGFTKP